MSEPYGNGGWLSAGTGEASNDTGEPEPVEYTCGHCRRGHHQECEDTRCNCCYGDG